MFEVIVGVSIFAQVIITIKILDIVDRISRKIELCYEIVRKNKE